MLKSIKEEIIYLTTKEQVEDYFNKMEKKLSFKEKEDMLKDVMGINEVFDVPCDYTEEDNYLAILSAFIEGSWRLL